MVAATTLPADVTIVDLPVAGTVTGAELFEAVQTSGGVGQSVQVSLANLMIASVGALPTGGTTGQLLAKNSGANYDDSWINLASQITTGTGLTLSGATSLVIAIATNAVDNTRIRQGSGLSVVGVTGPATANVADIAGIAAQALVVNDGGTGLVFGQVNLGSSAAVKGVLPNANVSAMNLGSASVAGGVQNVLPVASGGQGTSTLTAHAVLLGEGASTLGFAAIGTGGRALLDQGAAADPIFTVIGGDLVLSSLGTATITTNAVSLAKFAQATGLSVLANNSTATANVTTIVGAADQLLAINHAATTVLFRTISSLLDTAVNATQGSLLYRNAATWTVLGGGTSGQVLQTLGTAANPQWVGGMVLLNTLSPNGVATVGDTTSLTSTYRNYVISFENVCPATNSTILQLQVATTGTAFISGGYVSIAQVNVSSILITDTSTSVILLTGTRATSVITTTTLGGVSGQIFVQNPAGAGLNKQFNGNLSYQTPGSVGTTTLASVEVSGFQNLSTVLTGFQLSFSAGNIATGTIRIYGMS